MTIYEFIQTNLQPGHVDICIKWWAYSSSVVKCAQNVKLQSKIMKSDKLKWVGWFNHWSIILWKHDASTFAGGKYPNKVFHTTV